MVLIALLVLSLVCLIIGLVLTSPTWLIASLIATGGAAFLLWRTAPTLRSRPAAGPAHAGKSVDPAPVAASPPVSAPVTAPVTAQPVAPEPGAPEALAPTVAAPPAPVLPAPVLPASASPESASPASASLETVAAAPEPVAAFVAPAVQPAVPDVWVIDGRPRFHRVDCVQLVGQPIEPIPASQALEDGFIPCSLCAPNLG